LPTAFDATGRAVAGRTAYLLLHNTAEIVTPDPEGRGVLRYPKGAIVFREGRVLEIGPGYELSRRHGGHAPSTRTGAW
jgi:hypothetical protein